MSKYGNKKIKFDGFEFDSQMECDYYRYIKNNSKKLNIVQIELQPQVTLLNSFKYKGETIRAITYKPDFKIIFKDETICYVDVKGFKTNEFKIKEKMFKYLIKNELNTCFMCVTLHKEQWVYI